ncbi:MAG: SH3 domain-containing protein [Anaerolineaceae bacterium]|nr:SH3 domain-containing protein [Anaerolineaceae bacterium]
MNLARICVFLTLALTGLGLPVAAQTGSWTAEYYDNVEMTGNPVVVRSEIRPRGSWGEGSPHAGVPVDFFAARWTTRVWLEGGTYQLSAQADDGIRVLVDDVTIIDEWRASDAELFQEELPLETGEHVVVVEYLEQVGRAHLIFNMDPLLTPPPEDAPRARITARFLNMRNDSGVHGDVVKLVTMNQVLPVIGRNGLGTWLELEFGDLQAWVNASYVEAENLANVPITDGSPAPVTNVTAVVNTRILNLRTLPNQTGRILLRIHEGERYPVLGRSLDEDWLWLNVSGINGWAHSDWLDAHPGLETVPVLNEDAVLSDATVTADYLNVRAEPSLEGRILHIVTQGEIYAVIGRNADSSWVQLNTDGIAGWVSGAWITVLPDLEAVPVIDDSRETPPEEEEGGDDSGSLPPAQTPALQPLTAEPTPASS